MLSAIATLRDWYIRQRLRLRELRRICMKQTTVAALLWLIGLIVIVLVPLPTLALTLAALFIALLPVSVLLLWLIHIPAIWNIHASLVAIIVFASTALLSVVGRYLSGVILNDMFAEAPSFFPIAYATGTFFGTVFAMVVLLACCTLVILCFNLILMLFSSAAHHLSWVAGLSHPYRRRGWYNLGSALIFILAFLGTTISAAVLLERSETVLQWVAVEADFFPDHHCATSGWPEGITRVAFVGDEQVLGYLGVEDRIVVLPCQRRPLQGGAPR
ncbi:hypothetical protein [Paracoccus aminophilus]|uniref:Uncharacterized protein n=1 Tax=Paracoccus aminophilus JCM 7686 TaxID=1367847 RepID=S5YX14_PARAH|nr:hypothetical protein [Paracoccus aminophilus]AGT09756.1 hypothetical protein JCM7686_2700 [Paracoccus aminophilus JCM 7686]